ncbi:ABC transporter substrate-binding protein [Pseudomonas syringae]|uniref:ABC transporter substrate-binding protein n=1 Tax=Pseudomonas syringae TaxID=317 RepID=UPI00020987FF|nr:ABC transporter substrate-binding protein [Pseudomonas syringae]EGH71545.1 ABC transporter, periplasmic protein [Pseudomonas syringae pv. aceris str. M302273]
MNYLIMEQNLLGVKMVNVSVGNEVPALISGRGDNVLTFEPSASQSITQNGYHLVYSFPSGQSWSPFAFSSLTTTRKYVQGHPETTQKVVTAFEKASRFIYADVDASVAIAQKYSHPCRQRW